MTLFPTARRPRRVLSRTAMIVALVAAPLAASAQDARFTVSLGDRTIGTVVWSPGSLRTETTNAPLGIGNGSYTGQLKRAGGEAMDYSAHSLSSSEDRRIAIRFDGRDPVETTVSPESERTDMSDAAAVTDSVVDPVRAFGALLTVRDCPSLRIYDGRRISRVTTEGSAAADGALTCDGGYRVDQGATHLGPLGIRSARVTLHYAATGGGRYALGRMDLSAGPFTLAVTR